MPLNPTSNDCTLGAGGFHLRRHNLPDYHRPPTKAWKDPKGWVPESWSLPVGDGWSVAFSKDGKGYYWNVFEDYGQPGL
ncbi:unnamed protein product [Polarella glacialis]|nr:unnamed protein product [Polarella glacialis]